MFRKQRRVLLSLGLGASAVLVAALALVRAPQPNHRGNTVAATINDAHAEAIFTRSCANCHSNDTVWPWYSYVPPASWLVKKDVAAARSHLNLSSWPTYSQEKKAELLADIARVIANHEMPLHSYLLLHKEALLSEADTQALVTWVNRERRAIVRNTRPLPPR